MTVCQKLLKQESTARRIDNLPQPSKTKMYGAGCRGLLHARNPPRSAFLFQQFLAQCYPTSFLMIIILVSLIFSAPRHSRLAS